MWNDTDVPFAYLITFSTYGARLHGDPRGTVNRYANKYGTKTLPDEKSWLETNRSRMKDRPVLLDARMRPIVEAAIKETCQIREWTLYAVNVRTNHAHVVVAIGPRKPDVALNALKANATRMLREAGLFSANQQVWTSRGSTRYLWNDKSVADAAEYVATGQGLDLPRFD